MCTVSATTAEDLDMYEVSTGFMILATMAFLGMLWSTFEDVIKETGWLKLVGTMGVIGWGYWFLHSLVTTVNGW